ncbi:uncharacterized protein PAC_08468 [Phialocephala subalpina]|uniref:XPG-I domain-containing protein n=1 Tax=Phialocephala subalpina TaxID=576137 RepID=A0A1L7X0M3_9HELO|nr:uncharacterized protein PAC_08468 [Phialocephala subalpina]
MGIPQLWQKLGEGEVMDIAAYAAQHFEKHKRPLRIAIDEAIWRFTFWLPPNKVKWIRDTYKVNAHPNEKAFLWRILQLQRLNCQLVFVIDGPQRPKKRGKTVHGYNDHDTKDLRELLQQLGCPWHRAPGEAEAECVDVRREHCLQIQVLYKQTAKGDKKKDNWKVRVYQTQDTLQQYSFLTREGMVLFAVLVGADYDQQGLFNVGAEQAMQAAKNGLGELLCQASDGGTLTAWRDRLERFLRATGSKVNVPAEFPSATVVKNYYRPVVSSEETLRYLQRTWWVSTFDENKLRPLFRCKYNLWLQHYVELIIPILLVRSLAQTSPGQETSNKCYEIRRLGKAGQSESKIIYNLSTVVPFDLDAMYEEEADQGRPEKFSKRPTKNPECDAILDCILRHAVPEVMRTVNAPAVAPDQTTQPTSAPKKRGRPPKDIAAEHSNSKPMKKLKTKPTTGNELSASEEASKSKPTKKAKVKAASTEDLLADEFHDIDDLPSRKIRRAEAKPLESQAQVQAKKFKEASSNHTTKKSISNAAIADESSESRGVKPAPRPKKVRATVPSPTPQTQVNSKEAKTMKQVQVIDLLSDDDEVAGHSVQLDESILAKEAVFNWQAREPVRSTEVNKTPDRQPLDPKSPNALRRARLNFYQQKAPQPEMPTTNKISPPSEGKSVKVSFDSDEDHWHEID